MAREPGTGASTNEPTPRRYVPPGVERQSGKNRRTYGGYVIPEKVGLESETGVYESSPRGIRPVPMSRWKPGVKEAKWTYQNYDIPEFEGSPLVGMPSASAGIIYNGAQLVGTNTKQDLQAILDSKNTRQIRALQSQMYQAGWITKQSITGKTTGEAFQNALAFLFYQGNVSGRGWRDVLSGGPSDAGVDEGGGPGGGGPGGGREIPFGTPVTNTSTSLNEATKGQARAYLKEALATVLGRGPKPGEFNAFLDALRDKEDKNPSVTVTTSTQNSQTDSSSTSETSGGMSGEDYAQFAENFAEDLDPKQARRYKRAEYEQLLTSLIESM